MIKKLTLLVMAILFALPSFSQIQTLQLLGQLNFPTTCAGVWHYVDASGNEYALLGNGDGIAIVDVTNPSNPTLLFTVPANPSLWREIKTYQHYAYAGTEGGGGITIIDLSGLPGSYTSKVYDGDGAIAGQLGSSHTVQVFGSHLYIFGSALGTVMCSLADPWNPTFEGIYSANYVHDGYVLNDTLYSSEIFAGQFSVVDVTDKANPVVLATQPTPGAFNHNGWFSDNRQYFYTTDELNNTPLGVFDVSDINDIQLVNTYYNDSMPDQEVHNVRVFNDYLVNPSYGAQLTIVDAARPLNLVEIARHPTGPYLCWDAVPYLPSGNIIATDMSGKFYVFAPYYMRACYLEGNVTDLSNGNPINTASVKILSTTVTKSSDVMGDYRTGYPTPGTFDVEFSKSGYITKVVNGVVLTNGVVTVLDVQLEPVAIGLGEAAANSAVNIQVAPNPSSSIFEIQIGNYQFTGNDIIVISDVTGREVMRVHPRETNQKLVLDGSAWAGGIYGIRLFSGEKSIAATKLVKF
jgi:choice-of-anchor B domain-containing protein